MAAYRTLRARLTPVVHWDLLISTWLNASITSLLA